MGGFVACEGDELRAAGAWTPGNVEEDGACTPGSVLRGAAGRTIFIALLSPEDEPAAPAEGAAPAFAGHSRDAGGDFAQA